MVGAAYADGQLERLETWDYHRAVPAIAEGERAAEQVLPELRELIGVRGFPLPGA